jgi:exodeoxyribonuclease-3
MKIVSWNVNGLRALADKNLTEAIKLVDADVLCLQETKADPDTVCELFKDFPEYTVYAQIGEKKGYSGTALLTRLPVQHFSMDPTMEPLGGEGRIQCADFGSFYLVNVYVPNSGQGLKRLDFRKQWDAAFLKYLSDLQVVKPVILCGDLNVAHNPIDLKNDKANYNKTPGYTQVEIDGFERLLESGFLDVYRNQNPDKEAYTYWSYRFNARTKNIGWRIDYFLISDSFKPEVGTALILAEIMGSDHCPIALEIHL